MDKCFIVTIVLLVYLTAVVDSLISYTCEEEEEDNEKLDLRLELPSDTSEKTNTMLYLCNYTNNESFKKKLECNAWTDYLPTQCSGDWSNWSSWSECKSSEGYKHRSLKCHSNHSECLFPSKGSSFEISRCIPASSTTEKENENEGEKRYTLTEIIVVALGYLLLGILFTTLVFLLYMKRTQQGCFSKHIKDVQSDAKQQSESDMQFLTESGFVKKCEPNNPKSADSKNENKADETQYQSLISNKVCNAQKAYDQFNANVPRSDRQGHQPSSSRLQRTGNGYQIDQITNLQRNNEGVYKYCRDSEIAGHNYFVLERENMSQEGRARNLERPEAHAKMDDEVKDSTLLIEDKQSDAAHRYFILERIENGHNQDGDSNERH